MLMPTLDFETAARSSLDSDPDLHGLLSIYARKVSADVSSLEEALAKRSWTDLKGLAHRLKGTAAMYGFATLSDLFAACERAEANHEAYDSAHKSLRVAHEIVQRVVTNYAS